jgi:hypothetical protein
MSEEQIKSTNFVILTKDTEIAGRILPKGTKIHVTRGFGKQLIREGKARDENFVEKLTKKRK